VGGGGAGAKRQVVIVGGGFGGLAAARALRRADVDVTLVDRTNHHLFQPLLYQVAAGGLSEGACAATTRTLLRRSRRTTVLMAEVVGLDVAARRVGLDDGSSLPYDSLIVAAGAQTSYFGNDDWAEHAGGLKTLADAVVLRDRIFGAFERAERSEDQAERERLLSFVVVGGGPTGVEVAGQLCVLARHTLARDFRRIDTTTARVTVVDVGERLVPAFDPRLSAKVAEQLASLGGEAREGARVTRIDADGVDLEVDGATERLAAGTVIWAAGVRAADLAAVVATATGAATDRGGRIEVEPTCAVPGHPEIAVVGDMASHPGPGGTPLPGLATVAIQQAHHVAKGIAAGNPGATEPFRYFDKGALAVVGRGRAVCEVRGRRLSGRLAFFMYLGVHLYYLSGVLGHRLGVLFTWTAARFGVRGERLIEGRVPGRRRRVGARSR
jgi:NADH dehydrogenase